MPIKINSSGGGSVTIDAPVTASNYTVIAPTQSGTYVVADANGQVGVGTSSPAAPLDVVGNSSAIAVSMRGRSSDSACVLRWMSNDGSTVNGRFQVNSGGDMIFQNTNSITERMRIASNGNIRYVSASSYDGAQDAKLQWVNENQNGVMGQVACIRETNAGAPGALAFYTSPNVDSNGYNPPERMRLSSAGTLFIGGTTSPAGTQRLVLTADGGAGPEPLLLNELRTGNSNENSIRFYRNGSQVGSVTNNATNTAYNTSSDYRLKENIAPMTGALEKVAQLKPCTYTWKVNGAVGQGFIAHELAEVVPQAVTGEKDAVNEDGSIKPQGIDTSFLVATLTAAIQELNAKVEAQAAEIAALKGQAPATNETQGGA